MARVFKNVTRQKSPGRYKDGCSKMRKPDDYAFFFTCLYLIYQGELYSFMANLYKSHLNNQKNLSEAILQVHMYVLHGDNFSFLLIVFKFRLLVAHKYMYALLLMDLAFNLQLQVGECHQGQKHPSPILPFGLW